MPRGGGHGRPIEAWRGQLSARRRHPGGL